MDSSAFIAFLDQSDTYHAVACQRFENPPACVTTAAVMVETHGWFLRRYDAHRAIQFLEFIKSLGTRLELMAVGEREIHEGETLLRKFHDQPLTLVDAIGLWVMEHRKIRECWSTDRHLGLRGARLEFLHH